ncbi:MAG: VCBS repeat-containing protein [Planctomycetes bacterium]|nr:VCBS repeat-containing protein [Planctomycetota bacterium]
MNRKHKEQHSTGAASSPAPPRRRRLLVLAFPALVIASGIWFAVESSTPRLLARAENAAERREFAETERLVKIVLRRNPNSVRALYLAGVAASETSDPESAMDYFARIPDDGTPTSKQALFTRAEFSYQQGWVADSERLFRRVVELDKDNFAARQRLLYIYAAQGRMWEVTQLILPLLKSDRVDSNHLIAIGSSKRLMDANLPFVKRCLAARPDDPLPRLLEAKWAIYEKRMLDARDVLLLIVREYPHLLDARAALGETLLETGTPEEFVEWHEQLPDNADEHPEIWFVRGMWSRRTEQTHAAVRCFGEVLRRNPNHAAANYQLSKALTAVGKPDQAEAFATRARKLARMTLLIDDLINSRNMREAVKLLRDLGRLWEAAGWCRLAMEAEADWAKPALDQLLFELADEDSLTTRSANLALQLELSAHSLPNFQIPLTKSVEGTVIASANGQVRFRDVATDVALTFTYFNGAIGNNLESLLELNGGGIGAIDYDLDGWSDLYMTEGGPLPRRKETPTGGYHDRLFRNQNGETFVDISRKSRLDNKLYSQGLAVGDIDADGFPDLYVANIGTNVLYRNNGDGTFQEVTVASGVQYNVWTSSCLIADLNGDTLPDIYAVNYVGGDELYTQECRIDTLPRCAPIAHPPEQDRLYINGGDGTFNDVTDHCGVVAPEGRGLGIVAADFDGSRRLSLFVANDMSANFFFHNQTTAPGSEPKFVERAILNGLAYSSNGTSQASMGIAISDANQDGLLDMFVTNFYRDTNAFYMQQPDGLFRDEIADSQLQQATFPVLGWGTQFVDVELDGISDLLVTNGHVHDPWVKETPYYMQPQLFRGDGVGHFEEVPSDQLGNYFEGKYLGRAMARLDWNRDGLEDVCIGHLDSPVALLSNETVKHGHWLSLSLVGVHSDRDAVGSIVEVKHGGHTAITQLTAGDGFQCSNERRLVIGLGNDAVVDDLQIKWRSGNVQTFNDLSADRELIIVEGTDRVWDRSTLK